MALFFYGARGVGRVSFEGGSSAPAWALFGKNHLYFTGECGNVGFYY